jgi:ribonuclease P protein component
MTKREGFPPERRVRRRPDYLAIQGKGRRWVTPHFLVFVLRRGQAEAAASRVVSRARFGITVSRKVGSAVTRNRIKRWVRECCRRETNGVTACWDVVVVAKPGAADVSLAVTSSELGAIWKRLASTEAAVPSSSSETRPRGAR